jgi:GntR family transcriptional regulator of arabinose operon
MSSTTQGDKPTDSSAPHYVRARDWLLDYIAEQKLGPGDRIPSERIIAGSLGLSRPTIARALSELVEEGVLVREKRMGTYVGTYSGRRLAARTRTIGIVMPWLSQNGSGVITGYVNTNRLAVPFRREGMSFQVMQGVVSALDGTNVRLVVHSNTSTHEEAEVLEKLPNEGLDGVVVMPSGSHENASRYAAVFETGLPMVFVDHFFPEIQADRVVTDNFGAARDAVRYLIGKGHRRIAHFTDFENMTSTMDREAGYRAALEEAGIEYDEDIVCGPQIIRDRRWSFLHALEHCLRQQAPVTAVFCLNDDTVLATLQAANKLGIAVPGDLAVAGFFDDHIPRGMPTPFIRMVQAKTEMGQVAARLLLERLAGEAPPEPRHVLLPADLVPDQEA